MITMSPEEKAFVDKELKLLVDPVSVLVFRPENRSDACESFIELLNEIASSEPRMTIRVIEEAAEREEPSEQNVDMFPAVVILDKDGKDHGIRYYGAPSAKLVRTFMTDLALLSSGKHGLEAPITERLTALGDDHLKVLVTPSAPNIEQTIEATHLYAYVSGRMKAEVIDLVQFPEIAEKYHVIDIPKTISREELRYSGSFTFEEGLQILEKRIGDTEP